MVGALDRDFTCFMSHQVQKNGSTSENVTVPDWPDDPMSPIPITATQFYIYRRTDVRFLYEATSNMRIIRRESSFLFL